MDELEAVAMSLHSQDPVTGSTPWSDLHNAARRAWRVLAAIRLERATRTSRRSAA